MTTVQTTAGIDFARAKNDINGNPRYICHFLNIANDYEIAINIANKIGGRKYHNKQYGGGLIFQSYNIDTTAEKVKSVKIN